MKTILLSSGFSESTLKALGSHWNIIDIPRHAKALNYLKTCSQRPISVVIGFVPPPHPNDTLQNKYSSQTEIPAQEMLENVHSIDPDLPVIISTGESHPSAIVELVKQGAFDYIVEPKKPSDLKTMERYNQELDIILHRSSKWWSTILENRRLKQTLNHQTGAPDLVSCSAAMTRVKKLISKVASTPATVLITGESGTGKELATKTIHHESNRANKSLVVINCGSLSETLLTSELFGHVKGAFTGADSHNTGLIRQAGEGTLFLDEIEALSPGFQIMLLRVLEERVARPVGGQIEYPVKCRFIAATNKDLEQLVQNNKFRKDLYYRLNVFHIEIPPLSLRREDIPLLANYFLHIITQEYGRNIEGFELEALELLEGYHWPGNVRELRNVIERAVILCDSRRISSADLVEYLKNHTSSAAMPIDTGQSFQEAMEQFETHLISSALERSGGNMALAARLLQIKRTTLVYRVNRLQIGAHTESPEN